MPEAPVLAVLDRARARLRLIGVLLALSAGAVVCAGMVAILSVLIRLKPDAAAIVLVPLVAGGLVAAGLIAVAWRRWSAAAVAAELESAVGTLDNLVITSVQVAERPGQVLPFIREAVAAEAETRLASVDLRRVLPATRAVRLCAVTLIGTGALLWSASRPGDGRAGGLGGLLRALPSASIDRVEVMVTPPAYARLSVETLLNPTTVAVLAGSRVRIVVLSAAEDVALREPGAASVALDGSGDTRAIELVAERSRTFAIGARTGAARDERLVSLVVRPDQRPLVRVSAPGRDVMFSKPQPVDLQIESSDDLALQSMALKFTRVSGSGESFSFEEGEVPLDIARGDERRWTATARWALDALKLEAGDALVYRAVARDSNPAGEEVSSESYLIEVGARFEQASAGFSIPEDDRRYAISQQMVIVKTERLLTERGSIGRDEYADRARAIGVEQRMVKAEFIFLSGGDVQDEVEEAEHSHELAEGRLENIGRAEMLRAIAAMTRAEEQLNQADVAIALGHERAALLALQRAFDRRRYFLRVTPERARIDASRRLTGSLAEARSWARAADRAPDDAVDARERELMAMLGTANADVAARVAAIDPASPEWLKLAQGLMALDAATRTQAVDAARAALRARAAARLAPAADVPLRTGPYDGHMADAVRGNGRPR